VLAVGSLWHDSFMCVAWLIHVCDEIHSWVWYDSFMCVTWLIHAWDTPHSCVRCISFMCATCLNSFSTCRVKCQVTNSCVASLILICCVTHSCFASLILMCCITHSDENECCNTWMSYAANENEWCNTWEWVLQHILTFCVTRSNVLSNTFSCVASLILMCCVTHSHNTWQIHTSRDSLSHLAWFFFTCCVPPSCGLADSRWTHEPKRMLVACQKEFECDSNIGLQIYSFQVYI